MQVPIRLQYSDSDIRRAGNHAQQWGRVEHRMDIHWLSVNEPISPSAFDGTELHQPESVSDLLDPVKNNATSIIELMRRETPVETKPESGKVGAAATINK